MILLRYGYLYFSYGPRDLLPNTQLQQPYGVHVFLFHFILCFWVQASNVQRGAMASLWCTRVYTCIYHLDLAITRKNDCIPKVSERLGIQLYNRPSELILWIYGYSIYKDRTAP